MDDSERKQDLLKRLQEAEGINERIYNRIASEIESAGSAFGRDKKGRLKIAIFSSKTYDIRSFNEANRERFAIRPLSPSLNRDTVHLAEGYQAICIFVNDICDAEIVEELAHIGVRLIALRCAGFNNVDLEACSRCGIEVVRVPAYSPYAVAEHTVALMLMLNRHLHQAYIRNRAGSFVLEGLTGFDMRGKTVGVIGTGKIGQCVVDILLGFGCRVLAYDKYPSEELEQREGVTYVALEDMWPQCDILTLHAPLFPDTHHMINKEVIEQMKTGAMLINTSRGGLIDTRALIEGLKTEKIGSAGLDVYEEEAGIFFNDVSDRPLTDDVLARLITFNNVVITSHQAFLTREALSNIAETTLSNAEEFAEGKRGGELTHSVECE
ncbi:MAG: hydroxyacid dehydrogenase [Verrucomicrobiales bacterium]|nr:hydroxyacid dehydrogenase [Verrucomicrobiales bacterium]